MRDRIIWGQVSYDLILKDGTKEEHHTNCFGGYLGRPQEERDKVKTIVIKKLKCKPTLEYTQKYLNYINSMLRVNAVITEDSFSFRSFKNKYDNLLVLSMVRFLYEKIGSSLSEQEQVAFLDSIFTGESKYEDKLERFCDFYSRIKSDYFSEGHSWKPKNTKIKSTQDWLNRPELNSVNEFFTK